MPLDVSNSYLLKYNKSKRGTPEEFNSIGADISQVGLDNNHLLTSDPTQVIFLDTQNGNDLNNGETESAPVKTPSSAVIKLSGARQTVYQINDYPIAISDYNAPNSIPNANFQSKYSQPLIDTVAASSWTSSSSRETLSVAWNGEAHLLLVLNGSNYEYWVDDDPAASSPTQATGQPAYLTSNKPEKIFSNNGFFYLFFNDRTFKAGSDGVFDDISAVHEYAYDVAWSTQNVIKVADTAIPAPSDVGTWGTTEWWDGTSAKPTGEGTWDNSATGGRRLMVQPLNFLSETPNALGDYLDGDEEINAVCVNSEGRVFVGTVNPDTSAGTYEARLWYSDDLTTWTLGLSNASSQYGVESMIAIGKAAYASYHKATTPINEGPSILAYDYYLPSYDFDFNKQGSINFYLIPWVGRPSSTVAGSSTLMNLGKMPVVVSFGIDSATLNYRAFGYGKGPAQISWGAKETFISAEYNATPAANRTAEIVFGVHKAYCTNDQYWDIALRTQKREYNTANCVIRTHDHSSTPLIYEGCEVFMDPSGSSVMKADSYNHCKVFNYSRPASQHAFSDSYIVSNKSGVKPKLSEFSTLSNTRLLNLEYDQTTSIQNLTVDNLSQSTVTVLNASLCKFYNIDGAVSLAGGAILSDNYFSNDWSMAISNSGVYTINHCTFNGTMTFTTATAPTTWSSENSIFLNLSFSAITSGNEVEIAYGGIVGSVTGATLGSNVRRDNPLFQTGTDGLLQRELDGFLQDSPYIRAASDINATTGARRDLGCYNIDDSLIVATYATSVYLPKPPGGSITITETPLASVHTAISGQPDVFNDPNKRTEQVEITYQNIDNDVYDVYREIETSLENMSVYLALDPYYLTDLPTVTTSAAASIGQTYIDLTPVELFAGTRFTLSGIEYFIRYKVLNSSNQATKIVLDRPLESAVSLGASLTLTHPVGTGEYQYIPQPRTFTRADSQDMEVKGPFKIVLVRKPE
jgi:hypothetical protein